VNDLGGERIDIVPWSPDPERFARLALAPARVARVFSDPDSKTIQAIVDEDQLSLAIGRNGQNVRLASELTGWKIDLYSSREWLERGGERPLFAPLPPAGSEEAEREGEDVAAVPLAELGGISQDLLAVLDGAGYKTFSDILDLEPDEVRAIPGMAPEMADRLLSLIDELTTTDAPDANRSGNDTSDAPPARSGPGTSATAPDAGRPGTETATAPEVGRPGTEPQASGPPEATGADDAAAKPASGEEPAA
jgi:N utilization substance protein A